MADRSFPRLPSGVPPVANEPIVRVVRRGPLAPIREVLAVSIHDVVNDRRVKQSVAELWRVSRWIDNDRWLRRALQQP